MKRFYPLSSTLLNILLTLVCLTTLSTCNDDEESFLNPDIFKIYADDFSSSSTEGIVASEVMMNDAGEIVVFAVKGNEVDERFEGDSLLYMTLSTSGAVVSEKTNTIDLAGIGFMSNVLLIDTSFYFIWNVSGTEYQQMGLQLNQAGELLSSHTQNFDYFSTKIISDPDNSALIVLGLGEKTIETGEVSTTNKIAAVERLSLSDFSYQNNLSQSNFIPLSLGVRTEDDIAIQEALNHHLILTKFDDTYFVNAPNDTLITASYVGEQDNLFYEGIDQWWLMSMTDPYNDGNIGVVGKLLESNTASFVSGVSPSSTYNNIVNLAAPGSDFNIESNSRIFTLYFADVDRILVAGTNISGRIILYVYNTSGNLIGEQIEIGHTYDYKVAGIVANDTHLFIVGNTKIANHLNRVFLLRTSLSELNL